MNQHSQGRLYDRAKCITDLHNAERMSSHVGRQLDTKRYTLTYIQLQLDIGTNLRATFGQQVLYSDLYPTIL